MVLAACRGTTSVRRPLPDQRSHKPDYYRAEAVTGLPVPFYSRFKTWPVSSAYIPGDFQRGTTTGSFQPVATLSLLASLPPTPPGGIIIQFARLYDQVIPCQEITVLLTSTTLMRTILD